MSYNQEDLNLERIWAGVAGLVLEQHHFVVADATRGRLKRGLTYRAKVPSGTLFGPCANNLTQLHTACEIIDNPVTFGL